MSEVYPMIPAASKAVVILASVCVLLVGLTAVLGIAAYSAGHTRFELSERGLAIQGDPFFGRTLEWSQLAADEARIIDFRRDSQYRPARRTWGTGMPGYRAGWFRLASGERALVFMTAGDRAVHLPTHEGFSLVLGAADPEAMLAGLQSGSRAR
jgi:hypothetical protein